MFMFTKLPHLKLICVLKEAYKSCLLVVGEVVFGLYSHTTMFHPCLSLDMSEQAHNGRFSDVFCLENLKFMVFNMLGNH
jgi:hypothetical protein